MTKVGIKPVKRTAFAVVGLRSESIYFSMLHFKGGISGCMVAPPTGGEPNADFESYRPNTEIVHVEKECGSELSALRVTVSVRFFADDVGVSGSLCN